jgi:hypothetical protein
MKAVVKSIDKAEQGGVPVVEVAVDYTQDDGAFHSTQRYAFTPDQLEDMTIFDRQAFSMQNQIEDAIAVAAEKEKVKAINKPVEDKVSALRNHFKLDFAEQIPMNDVQGAL